MGTGRRWLGLLFFLAVGCFSRAQYDQAHQQRVTQIDGRYDTLETEEAARWSTLISRIDEQRTYLVAIAPGTGYHPVDRVDTGDAFKLLEQKCVELANAVNTAAPQDVPALQDLAKECATKLVFAVYVPQLRAKYWKADADWAVQEWKRAKFSSDVESLFAFSHNRALLAEIEGELVQVETARDQAIADLRRMRALEVAESAEQRDTEVAAAQERHRAKLAAVAGALSAMGDAMSRPNTGLSATGASSSATASAAAASNARACMDDYACGIGFTCVKPLYSSNGYCARAVNEYGVQTFGVPSPDSVGPNMRINTSCTKLGCPGGFSCDYNSGACLR